MINDLDDEEVDEEKYKEEEEEEDEYEEDGIVDIDHTVTADDVDDAMDIDSDFDNEDNDESKDKFGHLSRPSMSNVFNTNSLRQISVPVVIDEEDSKFDMTEEKAHYKFHINGASPFQIDEAEYLPFYDELRVDEAWWLNKYEPCRKGQNHESKK